MSHCEPTPTTLFVFPDPLMCGGRNIHSVTSQAGAQAPVGVSDKGNCGDLTPRFTGNPSGAVSPPFELLIQDGGNIAEAGFLWRSPGGTYRGADDGRKTWRIQAPFTQGTHPDADDIAVTWMRDRKRLFLTTVDASTEEFVFRRREDGAQYDTWIETTLDPTSIGAPSLNTANATNPHHRVATAYTGRGFLLLAYTHVKGNTPTDRLHIALLKSTDGGITWSLLHKNLTQTEQVSLLGYQLHLTVSGTWVRLDYAQSGASPLVVSRASNDNGLSFSPEKVSDFNLVPGAFGPDPGPYSVTGLGGGNFLLMYVFTILTQVRTAAAFGNAGFRDITGTGGGAVLATRVMLDDVRGIQLALAHDRAYALISTDDGAGQPTDDQLTMLYHEVTGIFSHGPGILVPGTPADGEWQPVEPLNQQHGARFLPLRGNMVHIGDRFVSAWNFFDAFDGTERASKGLMEISGTSARSYGNLRPNEELASLLVPTGSAVNTLLYDVWWGAPFGRPAGGATGAGGGTSPDTAWVETSAGAPTITYSFDQLSVVTGIGDANDWGLTLGSGFTDSWAVNGSTVGATCRINSGSSDTVSAHGMTVNSASTTAGSRIAFSLFMSTAGIGVFDISAAAIVASIAIDMTDWTEVRVAFFDNGVTIDGEIVALRHDAYFTPVSSSFTLTTAVVAPADTIRFGAPGSTVAGDSDWREAWVSEFVDRDIAFSSPGDMVALPTSLRDVPLEECIFLSWGGGSAARGDTYTARERYQHPAESIFLDACLIDWRSGGPSPLAPQELIFVADPDNPARRFMHGAVVLCGIEEPDITIDWDNAPDFLSPVLTTVMDTRIYTALDIDSVEGNGLRVTPPSSPTRRFPVSGELAGLRLVVTSGAGTGTTLCITRMCRDGDGAIRLFADAINVTLASLGIAGGDTFDVFTPFGLVRLPAPVEQRFMRLRFDATNTCTGDHRLGAIVAGCELEVPNNIPLEWTHGDATQSDVQVFEGADISWAYKVGTARKLYTYRIVNDFVKWRETFRFLSETLASFEARPMAMVPDVNEPRNLIRARSSQQQLENSFWFDQDDGDGRYRFAGGDMQIQMLEVP